MAFPGKLIFFLQRLILASRVTVDVRIFVRTWEPDKVPVTVIVMLSWVLMALGVSAMMAMLRVLMGVVQVSE